jgi:predicted NAD/FAD-binding protein
MAAAIWSAPCAEILSFPATAFIRFHDNHGLLKLSGRPIWRTVTGGSRSYVERLRQDFKGEVCAGAPIVRVLRGPDGVVLQGADGSARRFDRVVLATHADEALSLLAEPTHEESEILGAFRYSHNVAVLHSDATLMPRRRAAWSSWNHIGERSSPNDACAVTYWMNRLQGFEGDRQLFVTLNPPRTPRDGTVVRTDAYQHPLFDAKAIAAQSQLWSLQGTNRTWFCGAYFGAGFHEDGLQAGLAVAEHLGGAKRPWTVAGESDRIVLPRISEALARAAA